MCCFPYFVNPRMPTIMFNYPQGVLIPFVCLTLIVTYLKVALAARGASTSDKVSFIKGQDLNKPHREGKRPM